jgi:hypothetical protein
LPRRMLAADCSTMATLFTKRFTLPGYLRWGLLSGVLVALTLVILGRHLVPATSLLSTAAASVALLLYAALAALLPFRLHARCPEILRASVIFGLLAGAVFVSEIVLEYVFLPSDNSRWGYVEFGAVFALYFLSALTIGFRVRNILSAVLAACASSVIASLMWVITVLTVFYLFRGSAQQVAVFTAEGDFEDFARSGMRHFDAFMMEDFMGATFFHLLLGVLVAAVLGFPGGLLGKATAALRN